MSEREIDGRRVRDVPCPLCGSWEREARFAKHGFTWARCVACSLTYVTPRLTEEAIAALYAEGFAGKDAGKPVPLDDTSFQPAFRAIERHAPRGRLLDVGCFTGHFLAAAHRRGFRSEGTEICPEAAERAARNTGRPVHVGELATLDLEEGAYDAVTMLDVLEHLVDPVGDLERVLSWLRPGGVLYLETPNADALARRRFGARWCAFFPWHLTCFTRATLERLARSTGYVLQHVTSEDLGPWSARDPYAPPGGFGGAGRRRAGPLRAFALRHRRVLKPVYRGMRPLWNVPLHALSALSLPLGGKLVAVFQRPASRIAAHLEPHPRAERSVPASARAERDSVPARTTS